MKQPISKLLKQAMFTIAAAFLAAAAMVGVSRAQQQPPQYTPQQVEEVRKKAIEMGLLRDAQPAPKKEPRVVTPGAKASDPPSDAVVLFDGKDLSKWKSHRGRARRAEQTEAWQSLRWHPGSMCAQRDPHGAIAVRDRAARDRSAPG